MLPQQPRWILNGTHSDEEQWKENPRSCLLLAAVRSHCRSSFSRSHALHSLKSYWPCWITYRVNSIYFPSKMKIFCFLGRWELAESRECQSNQIASIMINNWLIDGGIDGPIWILIRSIVADHQNNKKEGE